MNDLDLTGKHISVTYPRILQTDNGFYYDGLGNTVSIGSGGPQGYQGPRGDLGAYGPQGTTGPRGDIGAYGPQGGQGEIGFQGNSGVSGNQGLQGFQGFQGVGGASNQTENFNWKFQSSTTGSDPGSGNFRFDNSIQSLVTNIYVDDLCEGTGLDISLIFSGLTGNYVIYIQQTDDATKFTQFTTNSAYIDNTGWWTIPVTFSQAGSGGMMANNTKCTWYIINKNSGSGSSGPQGPQGSGSETGNSYFPSGW